MALSGLPDADLQRPLLDQQQTRVGPSPELLGSD
jgi:hypothetical protein